MLSPDDIPAHLWPALDRLSQILNERQVRYAVIGGVGVAMRGPIRPTRDIDVMLSVPQVQLPGLLDSLVQAGFTLDPLVAIHTWNRVHLLDFSFGPVRIDVLQPVLP